MKLNKIPRATWWQRLAAIIFLVLWLAAWAVLCIGLAMTSGLPTEEPAEEPAEMTLVHEAPAPVAQIVEKPAPPVDDGPDLDKLPKIENATLTHYDVCKKCCGKDQDHPAYGITASGRAAEPYVSMAVDPFLIPLGSTVYVDYGDGELHEYRADDTGSGVAGAHLDLCVTDHQEALELGVKTVAVWYDAPEN